MLSAADFPLARIAISAWRLVQAAKRILFLAKPFAFPIVPVINPVGFVPSPA